MTVVQGEDVKLRACGTSQRNKARLASCLFLSFVMTGSLICAQAAAQAPEEQKQTRSSASSPKKGKELYTSSGCYECHGREGQGSRMSGPRIGPPPMDEPSFTEYIRQPGGQMPPYTSKVLTDAEVADIYSFLKSLPPPPSVKDIPLLNDGK